MIITAVNEISTTSNGGLSTSYPLFQNIRTCMALKIRSFGTYSTVDNFVVRIFLVRAEGDRRVSLHLVAEAFQFLRLISRAMTLICLPKITQYGVTRNDHGT